MVQCTIFILLITKDKKISFKIVFILFRLQIYVTSFRNIILQIMYNCNTVKQMYYYLSAEKTNQNIEFLSFTHGLRFVLLLHDATISSFFIFYKVYYKFNSRHYILLLFSLARKKTCQN